MADFLFPAAQAAQHAQHIVNSCPVIPPCPTCPTGVSFMTNFISVALAAVSALAAGFGLGWYVKGRGLQGVENDLSNAKTTVTNAASSL